MTYKSKVRRVVFNGLKLESYREAHGLGYRDIADLIGMNPRSYYNWIRRSYAPASRIEKLKLIEITCNLDLGLEIIPPMTPYEAEAYAKNKYMPVQSEKASEVNEKIVLYPKNYQRCPWRRGAMCLTPLCMKRRHEYDPGMPWGGHLEICKKWANKG